MSSLATRRGTWERDVGALNRDMLLQIRAALRSDFQLARQMFGLKDVLLAQRIERLDQSEIDRICHALGAIPLMKLDETPALQMLVECATVPAGDDEMAACVASHATQSNLLRASGSDR